MGKRPKIDRIEDQSVICTVKNKPAYTCSATGCPKDASPGNIDYEIWNDNTLSHEWERYSVCLKSCKYAMRLDRNPKAVFE